jgi:hypothetical protein
MRGLREVLRDAFSKNGEGIETAPFWDAVTETIPISIFRFADIRSQRKRTTESICRFEMGKDED